MIGAKKAMAFDLTAACSGFVVGLITAAQFIRTGRYRNIVIIGADALSRYVDWRDRGGPLNTLVLTTCHMAESARHVLLTICVYACCRCEAQVAYVKDGHRHWGALQTIMLLDV